MSVTEERYLAVHISITEGISMLDRGQRKLILKKSFYMINLLGIKAYEYFVCQILVFLSRISDNKKHTVIIIILFCQKRNTVATATQYWFQKQKLTKRK